MSARGKIFHDSWYRIANERISIRPSVRIQRQMYSGELWYVLQDPYTNQFYRFPPEVYEFIARMNPRKTVDEIWNELLTLSPEMAPTQGDIIDLLSQLFQSNLIHSSLSPDSLRLFERYEKREKMKIKMQLLNILFARIPIYDPDKFLKALMPFIRLVFSPLGLFLWLFTILIGFKGVFDNVELAVQQSQGLLAPSNLFLLYIGTIIVKLIHEIGHASAVRRFGGEVHTLGIMFMMLTPLPYMDATSAWSFRSKWKRVLVGASGMLFELFIAAIAIIIWANTGDGVLHSLSYNMAFTASVSSVIFNINPLLKYDGYYMLADLVDIPNLQQQGQKETIYFLEKFIFGKKDGVPIGFSVKESILLVVYNIFSTIYRFIVFGGILFFISTKYLPLAIFMGIFLISSWLITPMIKGIKYLTSSPSIARVRSRAIYVTVLFFLLVFLIVALVPFPLEFKAPGVLKAEGFQSVVNQTAGVVEEINIKSGATVHKGDTLLILNNQELEFKRKELIGAISEIESSYRLALTQSPATLKSLATKRQVLQEKLVHIDNMLSQLVIIAHIDGHWYSPEVDNFSNRWIPKGTEIGKLINGNRFFFLTVVPQQEIGQLFSRDITNTAIRLKGEARHLLSIDTTIIIPMEQQKLPSMALGFMGGGEIATKTGDGSGTITTEPFYEVRVGVVSNSSVLLLQGRTGVIRFSLGNEPLLWQGLRKLRQLIQKNYKV